MRPLPRSRLLAIDPTRHGFAYVLLESQILIDWGVVDAGEEASAAAHRLEALISRYTPTSLIIEHHMLTESRRSPRAREFLVAVELLGLLQGVAVERISRSRLAETFPDAKNKHDIALLLADRYPELRMWRPRRRKPWMSEDERMNIFDALALAETYLSSTDSLSIN
jgi:hypothetical protein